MKIGILGFGTVGGGVYEMLDHTGGLERGPVLVRPGKDRMPFMVTDVAAILEDPTVDAVVEVLGGIEPAHTWVRSALLAGKHVVTANKALVVEHGLALAALAREKGVAFLFSAACGGGVPFLHNLSLARRQDEVLTLEGILNGTTNYMLEAMQCRGVDYETALADAQALGYAEADPSADVSGLDALRKMVLACAVAFERLPREGTCHEGITHLTVADMEDFQARGLTCRLMARGGLSGGSVYAFVEPVLVSPAHPACAVKENFNMARYEARCAGQITLIGQGAGRFPTASAVLRDLACIQAGHRAMLPENCVPAAADCDGCKHPYYVRVPASFAGAFPAQQVRLYGDLARIITAPMTVKGMHRMASEIRSAGGAVFFAGMEG